MSWLLWFPLPPVEAAEPSTSAGRPNSQLVAPWRWREDGYDLAVVGDLIGCAGHDVPRRLEAKVSEIAVQQLGGDIES